MQEKYHSVGSIPNNTYILVDAKVIFRHLKTFLQHVGYRKIALSLDFCTIFVPVIMLWLINLTHCTREDKYMQSLGEDFDS